VIEARFRVPLVPASACEAVAGRVQRRPGRGENLGGSGRGELVAIVAELDVLGDRLGPGERAGWDVDAEEGEGSGSVSFSQALPSAQPWEQSLLRCRGTDVGSARDLVTWPWRVNMIMPGI
jgi:hypothetical protein